MAVKSKKEKLNIALFRNAENDIKSNIKVDPEFEGLIPPLTSDELKQLEESLKHEGCREPLIVWQSGEEYILVDGHNRYRLCQQHRIKFEIHLKSFSNRLEVKDWMINNQMARRNLTPLQMSYLRGIRYKNEKSSWGGIREKKDTNGHHVQLPSLTAEKLSEEYGVNEKTIRRDEQFALALEKLTGDNQNLRWNILSGNIKAGKKTITNLADSDPEFLFQLQEKIKETESLEKAIQFLQSENNKETQNSEEENDVKKMKQKLASLTSRALKLEKGDPKRKEVIKSLRQSFKEFLQVLEA